MDDCTVVLLSLVGEGSLLKAVFLSGLSVESSLKPSSSLSCEGEYASALYCCGRGSLFGTVGLRITGTGTLDLVFLVEGVLEEAGEWSGETVYVWLKFLFRITTEAPGGVENAEGESLLTCDDCFLSAGGLY